MQTLTEVAKEMISWERVPLTGGAHRINSMERVAAAPTIECRDCTYDEWFADDLILVKQALGIFGGVWCGLVSINWPQVVIALRLD